MFNTINEWFGLWGFRVDLNQVKSIPVNTSRCGSGCSHSVPLSVEEYLDTDLDAFGGDCDAGVGTKLDHLFCGALELEWFNERESDLADYSGTRFEDLPQVKDLILSNYPGTIMELVEDAIVSKLRSNREEAEAAFKRHVEAATKTPVDTSKDKLYYVALEGGGAPTVPQRIMTFLYGDFGRDVFILPQWSLMVFSDFKDKIDWEHAWTKRPGNDTRHYLGRTPVRSMVAVEETDDAEIRSTIKVLAQEMNLKDAVRAARNLKD